MIKEKTLTIELSHENPLGDGYFYAMLDLPAEEHEIRDAIQRARIYDKRYEDIEVKDGRQKLILSTCYGSAKSGRILVIAEET